MREDWTDVMIGKHQNNQGLSLVELIVSIGIFVLLVLVFAPFFAAQFRLLTQTEERGDRLVDSVSFVERRLADPDDLDVARTFPIRLKQDPQQSGSVGVRIVAQESVSAFASLRRALLDMPITLRQGYGPLNLEGQQEGDYRYVQVSGYNTSFEQTVTEYVIFDKNDQSVVGQSGWLDVLDAQNARVPIRVQNDALVASLSPYTLRITTAGAIVTQEGVQDEVLTGTIVVTE